MSTHSQTTVYIRELPARAEEKDIRNAFSEFGKIVDVQSTKKNFSAKVTFETHEQAQSAISAQNIQVLGRNVRVIWNHGSLILSNLPHGIEEPELRQCLAKFPIIIIQIRPMQQALITFSDQQIALDVMKSLNGFRIRGQAITAKVYHSPSRTELVSLPPFISFYENDDLKELPANAYASLKIASGTIVYFQPDESNNNINLNNNNNNQSNHNNSQGSTNMLNNDGYKVRSEVRNDALRFLENRSIYVDGFQPGTTAEALSTHFSKFGKVNVCKLHSLKAAIIQFDSIESRNDAFSYNKKPLPTQKLPLTILPYFDKQIPHIESGLLQINELVPTKTADNLRNEFGQFGQIIAVSITPTGFDDKPYGFVLYENYEHAKNAKQNKNSPEYPNMFLYPPMQTNDAILAFTENNTAPNNCLAIYDLPLSTTEPEVNQRCKGFGFIKSSFVLSDGKSKVGFIYYATPSDAVDAFNSLISEKVNCDLLNGNALVASSRRLTEISLPIEWNGLLLFIQGLPIDWGTSRLRSILVNYSIDIDSCFVNLQPITGLSKQTAIVLARNQQYAMTICQICGSYISKGSNATFFRSRGNYTRQEQPQGKHTFKYRFPTQGKKPLTPREWMKFFIVLNFSEKQEQLRQIVDELSINDTFCIASDINVFINWIEQKYASIK